MDEKESAVVQGELGDGITECRRWIMEIEDAKKAFKQYWEQCDRVVARYKDCDPEHEPDMTKPVSDRKYNVLWSMTETMKPLVYSERPQPYVSRRHSDRDQVGRDGSLILQRAISYDMEGDELHSALVRARNDFILCSRGVIWPKYRPYMQLRESEEKTYLRPGEQPPKGREVKQDEMGSYYHALYQAKMDEEVDWEHVHYRDFLHGPASVWKHVPWVARRVPMTREELIGRFGEKIGKAVPLSINNKRKEGGAERRDKETTDDEVGMFAKAEVWEVWCKNDKKVRWLCPDYKKGFLDRQDDFLQLRQFFPCPMPAYGLVTNDSLVPKPEFFIWQGIAVELDDITNRLKLLLQALRVAGVYDKSLGESLQRLTKQTAENDLIPVDNWSMFAERGGLKGMMEFLPIDQVAGVADRLYAARGQLMQELYDITGISDIVRGASDPRETAKAQQIKGNYAGKRIGQKQELFGSMVREALEIHAQIVCTHYSDNTITMISSANEIIMNPQTMQPDPQRLMAAMQLIRSAPLRRYRIKVDEKSLAAPDKTQDAQMRQEYLMGLSSLLQNATMMAKENPAAAPLMGELLMFGVRGFPEARSTEAALEQAIQQMTQAGPPPKEEQQQAGKSAAEIELEKQKLMLDQQRMQMENQWKQREFQLREMELRLKGQQDAMQTQNRETESLLRKEKQDMEALIRADQNEVQREANEKRVQLDLVKWMGDQEQKDVDREVSDTQHVEKLQADYVKAFQQAEAAKQKAKQSKAAA